MLALATKLKEQKDEEEKTKDKEIIKALPTISETKDVSSISNLSLSLNPDEAISREMVLSNVSVRDRQLKGSEESIIKAKRKVGRLTTGASAAVPLLCKGADCPFHKKCVSSNTKVLTPDGEVKIKNLKPGSVVYSIDKEGYLYEDRVTHVLKSGKKVVYELITSYGFKIRLTSDHPILTIDSNYKQVYKTIDNGIDIDSIVFIIDSNLDVMIDSMQYGDLFEDTVVSIEEVGEEMTYDITVHRHHNFIGNGITVHNCVYFQSNLHQVGEDCLLEEQLIEYWTQKYIDELNIDYTSISEMHSVSRLVEIAILDLRMTNYIAINDPDLMMDFIASLDPNGAAITNKGVSVAFEVKERLDRQRLKLLESLNNTRDKKAKLLLSADDRNKENSTKALLEKLDKLASISLQERSGNIIDAQVIEVK